MNKEELLTRSKEITKLMQELKNQIKELKLERANIKDEVMSMQRKPHALPPSKSEPTSDS